jgi:hypothetical protein
MLFIIAGIFSVFYAVAIVMPSEDIGLLFLNANLINSQPNGHHPQAIISQNWIIIVRYEQKWNHGNRETKISPTSGPSRRESRGLIIF